jgi:hypothetical protein
VEEMQKQEFFGLVIQFTASVRQVNEMLDPLLARIMKMFGYIVLQSLIEVGNLMV